MDPRLVRENGMLEQKNGVMKRAVRYYKLHGFKDTVKKVFAKLFGGKK